MCYAGVGAATKGTLSFLVGGAEADYARATPILQCMGKNVFHCGDHGNGQAAKVCNNMLLGISMIGTSEALQLAIRSAHTASCQWHSHTAPCQWHSHTAPCQWHSHTAPCQCHHLTILHCFLAG